MPAPHGNKNAAGFRKSEDERRIVVSFSISGVMLELLRERLAGYMDIPPEDVTVENIRSQVRQLALQAIGDYNAKEVPPDPEWEQGE
jgi:hypothetical protein